MAHLIPFNDKEPTIGKDVFIAPTATLIGDVRIGDGASIWFGAVLRADFGPITIGAGTSIQDNSVIHTYAEFPTVIGENVTVGHSVTVEGCRIGDNSLIGVNAVVLPHTTIGERVVVAAGSVVLENSEIPDRVLVAGVPAKVKGELKGRALEWTQFGATSYHELQAQYRAQGIGVNTSPPTTKTKEKPNDRNALPPHAI